MKKETLYKFFDGIALPEEKEAVRLWLDNSPENREELFREREFFDAVILSGSVNDAEEKQKNGKVIKVSKVSFIRSFVRETVKVAAVVAVTLTCGMFFYLSEKKEMQLAMNTIIVPAGQRVNLELPDGTNVWLNARSEMKYPAVFSASKREIKLNGEAYFEVAHDANKPFVVHTEKCDIEVLGTKFNLEAYGDSKDFSAALMEGSVRVTDNSRPSNSSVLSPDQEARFKNGILSVVPIGDYDHFRWRDGLVCFKDIGFKELMLRFEKCYGIRIVVENNKLDEYTCSGKFRISDGLDNALRILQRDAKYTFEKNKDDSVVYIK